ncbi:MAG: GH92 family glycosyl hydrolase [Capnocytophaga sp.]|uniref:GH92 family glycosyl hydrolase n=1 Tax=Capnocytophaga sp. TaxID=44737 RepID=UPI003F9FE80F
MNLKHISLVAIAVLGLVACQPENTTKETTTPEKPLISYVDPFIGTGGHGHTYPGATTPFGMIQVSPVNGLSHWDWCSGYHYSDSLMVGFGHLSLSGTGIGDLNDILLMPTTKEYDLSVLKYGRKEQYPVNAQEFRDMVPYKSKYSHKNEKATPGYYQVYLEDPKVNVELTAAQRYAVHRYTFEKGAAQSVILNLGYAINWDSPTETYLKASSLDTSLLIGSRFSTGWAENQKVFFAIKFSRPIIKMNLQEHQTQTTSGQFFFDSSSEQLEVKVAVSSVSEENALANLEIDSPIAFDTTKEAAQRQWEKTLSSITVETPVDSLKTIFYTALYHAQVAPVTFSDKNGQFRLQNDKIAQTEGTAYSTLSLWDTFRAEHPLLTLLQPKVTADIINSMLAYYSVNKVLPVWTLYGNETNTMTGYHSVAVIAEAYLKGVRGFDAEKAYEAMKTTMMQDDRGLKAYKKYGYIPFNAGVDESVTITLEYAYDDWCVAQMAKALGKTEDADFFLKRSEAYAHLFDKETGFMRGKSTDGKWRTPFDPKRSDHRENTDYTEGNAWQHSWFVPHNVRGLIELFGGSEPFVKHLEKLFTESSEITGDNTSPDISGLIGQYAHGNEPSHHIAYMFNVAGQPKKTQYWVDRILQTQYNTTPNGLSGNEDCGQMSAWYIWSAIGLYPMNPASTEYQFGRPLFDKVTIHLPNGKTFTIIAKNVSKDNKYIQSVKLNGKEYMKWFLSHQELLNGGELVFEMTNK